MPINFIPNDPLAGSTSPMRQVTARPDRAANRAGFNFVNAVPQGLFNPGTPGFLFWQCREAALAAIETWESINGNLLRWGRATPNATRLNLKQDDGDDLNAFYDGQSLSFFHHTTGTKTTFSAASTDVVAHEAGHGLLDSVRPPLFDSAITEHGAFHEAFGDCMALLTGFSDQKTRQAVLAASPNLGQANFLEATAEDLSDAVKRALGPTHPAAAPRHALNNFRFQLPTTLPTTGGPAVLTREIHSFGRVFSGCFYDTVRNIFNSLPNRNEAALLKAAQTAGKLLIAGAKNAPMTARFFQAVGRAMVLEDQAKNNGANRQAITDAFTRHNIALGSNAMLEPRATLAGAAPKMSGAKGILSAATVKDLRNRIEAKPGSKIVMGMLEIGGEKVAEAVHQRPVSLTGLDSRLKGVVAMAAEPVLVKSAGGMSALVSALPDPSTSEDEVQAFVETLLAHNRIAFDGKDTKPPKRRAGALGMVAARDELLQLPTHKITTSGGKKVLKRIRYLCLHTD
ncbi:MAG: M36 family metallopeptidase [Acidobacteriota bacterium]|nr:M36 family metallopeptidase [Acidobacteriota bacterium]